jgi:Fe-S-cluster containining protein
VGQSAALLDYGYADMLDADVARVSAHVRQQLRGHFIGGERRYLTPAKEIADGRLACRYLRGTPGKRCSCDIYATRPTICQDFKVGGVVCKAARVQAEAFL